MHINRRLLETGGFFSAVLMGAAALYQGLAVRRYALVTEKLRPGAPVRLVVVSDLHSCRFGCNQGDILRIIRSQRPDAILLPGDIVDDRVPSRDAFCFLRGVAEIAPSFYAPGNHEYRAPRTPRLFLNVAACGVAVLADACAALETPAGPLLLAGCEDVEKTRRQDPGYRQSRAVRRAFAHIGNHAIYTVLLAHRPERIGNYLPLGFDLVVSGHAHGGQVRIPYLLNGVFAPNQGFFPPFPGGCYQYEKTAHVVSRGACVFKRVPRIFNPPEITLIDLFGAPTS